MTTPSIDPSRPQARPRRRPFGVQQYNRALGLVTAVLLLSGFAVLRMLTGADDTPLVENGNLELPAPPPVVTPATPQDVHRLRPRTSANNVPGEMSGPLIEDSSAWHNRPATYWQLAPADDLPAGTDAPRIDPPKIDPSEVNIAQQPDLLR